MKWVLSSLGLAWGYHQESSGPDVCVLFDLWKLSLDNAGTVGSPEGELPCWSDTWPETSSRYFSNPVIEKHIAYLLCWNTVFCGLQGGGGGLGAPIIWKDKSPSPKKLVVASQSNVHGSRHLGRTFLPAFHHHIHCLPWSGVQSFSHFAAQTSFDFSRTLHPYNMCLDPL